MIEPPRVSLARLPTPLVPLDRLSASIGAPRIWLKRDDLTDMAASGNKLRKLEFSVARAEAEGASVLVTCGGVQSNHCRATAIIAARRGLKCHLLLRGKPPEKSADGNLMIDQLVGATVTFLSAEEWEQIDQVTETTCSVYRSLGETPFAIPLGASDETGLWGYIEACRELKADFNAAGISPAALVSATGSGGTLGGLIVGRQLHGLETPMLGICVSNDRQWFVDKIAGDIARWEARFQYDLDQNDLGIDVLDDYVGPGYGRAGPRVFETIRQVAETEGVILDPVYTGKAFDGMLHAIRHGRFDDASDLVFLHTGGLFGLFPQRDHL